MTPKTVRSLLVVVLLVVQMVTLVVMLMSMQRDTDELFRDHARATMEHLADTVADKTRRYLLPAESAIGIGRQLVGDGILDADTDTALERYFLAQLRASADIAGAYVGRRDGSFVYVKRDEQGFRSKFVRVADGQRVVEFVQRDAMQAELRRWRDDADAYDPRERPWYRLARASEAPIWTDPYVFFTSQRPGITVATTLRTPAGADAGVMGVDVEITSLSGFIASIPIGQNGAALVQDAAGVTVAYSDSRRLLASLSSVRLPAARELVGGPLAVLLSGVDALSRERALPPTQIGFREFKAGEEVHYGYVRPFSLGQAKPVWQLVVEAPATDFSGGVDLRYRNGLLTFLAVAVLVCVLAVLAVLRVTRPIVSLHKFATVDSLTGVPNRREFHVRLGRLLALQRGATPRGAERRAGERTRGVVVALFDLDGFKNVNDAYGHAVGDVVLAEFARRLVAAVRKTDIVGRYGGDEFVVALRLENGVEPFEAVERIRETVIREPFESVAGLHALGVTAGFVDASDGRSTEEALRLADEALILGKARRKNRTYMADAPGADPQANRPPAGDRRQRRLG